MQATQGREKEPKMMEKKKNKKKKKSRSKSKPTETETMSTSGSSAGADQLITITPRRLFYDPPYGANQTRSIVLKSTHTKRLGFKIEGNRTQFYDVTPRYGLLQPEDEVSIDFRLNTHFNKKVMDTDKGAHKFRFIAVQWPYKSTKFNLEMWPQVRKDAEIEETLTMEVDLDRVNPTFVTKERERPEPIEVTETEISEKSEKPTAKSTGDNKKVLMFVDKEKGTVSVQLPTPAVALIIASAAMVLGWILATNVN